MWHLTKLSEQLCPWDTLTCCWDIKQPTTSLNSVSKQRVQQYLLSLQVWIKFFDKHQNTYQCSSFLTQSVKSAVISHISLKSHSKVVSGCSAWISSTLYYIFHLDQLKSVQENEAYWFCFCWSCDLQQWSRSLNWHNMVDVNGAYKHCRYY